ncbi:alpha-N-acetyl-neuraminyl-2,3-beta-galactosyl-1,3-N-acetyl-galactosaminide alpha-2,6-sialyltransferase-like isoform X2 [Ptychodera flava]
MSLSVVVKPFFALVGVVGCVQVIVTLYLMNLPDNHHRFVPRHVTEKEVRGPTYHVHTIDPMSVDLRDKYNARRAQLEFSRPHLMARREILNYHRESVDYSPEPTDSDDMYESLGIGNEMTMHCRSCSLVSNSGHLLYSNAGDDIDSAQCVFRLNTAPTHGFELDVGKRTTARVVSHRSISNLAGNASDLISQNRYLSNIIFHGPEYKFSTGKTPTVLKRLTNKYDKVGFFKLSKFAETKADNDWEMYTGKSRISSGTEYSTGFYALMVMKDVCEDITVYGMIPETYCRDNPSNNIPYSYYETPSLSECLVYNYHEDVESGGHRLMTERRVFKAWTQSDNITFVNPSWPSL